jgi:cell division protease FtsH
VALCSEHADPVAKVTILPAGRSLGVTQQLPTDERHLYSESYLHDSLAVRLGGRAAELLVLGEASTGASSDLAGATELATRMVRDWGFSTRLGPVGFGSGGPAYLGQGPSGGRAYAEGTQLVIDEEVSRILSEAAVRAQEILSERRASLDAVIELLLEKETISGVELIDVVRRPIDAAERPPLRR